MSEQYDDYLKKHIEAVVNGFNWLLSNVPEIGVAVKKSCESRMILYDSEWVGRHDISKWNNDEYEAYDAYFYPGNKGEKPVEVIDAFNLAWLTHIRRNSHHWQHWVLINDDPNEGRIALKMPVVDVVEMICDWWAFSWVKGDLREIFKWYDEHKDYIILHPETRSLVENILGWIEEGMK